MYRLFFKGGLAYQYPWWKLKTFAPLQPGGRMPPMRLELANSLHAYQPGMMRNKELLTPNYGTYVCSMERESFMAKHSANVGEGSTVFHSAYTGGGPVIGVGSMLIEHGVVKGIRDDSRHYQLGATNMVGVLQALGIYGVRLSKVEIHSWDSKKPTILALDFKQEHELESIPGSLCDPATPASGEQSHSDRGRYRLLGSESTVALSGAY